MTKLLDQRVVKELTEKVIEEMKASKSAVWLNSYRVFKAYYGVLGVNGKK